MDYEAEIDNLKAVISDLITENILLKAKHAAVRECLISRHLTTEKKLDEATEDYCKLYAEKERAKRTRPSG